MNTNQQQDPLFVAPLSTLNKTVAYLATRPFNEVELLIALLKQSKPAQPVAPAESSELEDTKTSS